MGFLGLGNFATGFVTGFAKSVDRAVQDDIQRVNNRIDKISDIRLQKRLKDEEDRRDEIEDVKKALELGTSVFGDTRYSTAMLKKFGNDLPSYKQFINEFRAAKTLNPGLDTNAFFKILGDDKTPVTPTYTETQYAQSIVPPVPDYSKITSDTLGKSGTLISKLLGDKVDLLNTVNTQVDADIAAGLLSPTTVTNISTPQIEFDFEAFNLSKKTATEKIKYASEKILDTNLVGTVESRTNNPDGEQAKNYNKYVTMRRNLLVEASLVGSEEDKLEALNQLLSNAVPNNFDSKEDYETFYKNTFDERKALVDEIELKKVEASNDPLLRFEHSRKLLTRELAELMSEPPVGDEAQAAHSAQVNNLMGRISKINRNMQVLKTGKNESIAESLDRLTREFNAKQQISGLTYDAFIQTSEGRYLNNQIHTLKKTNTKLSELGMPAYTIAELNSSLNLINGFVDSTLEIAPIEGLLEFTEPGNPVYSPELNKKEKEAIQAELKNRQKIILEGGKINNVEYPGLLNTHNPSDKPELFAAAYNLGADVSKYKDKIENNNMQSDVEKAVSQVLDKSNLDNEVKNEIKKNISSVITNTTTAVTDTSADIETKEVFNIAKDTTDTTTTDTTTTDTTTTDTTTTDSVIDLTEETESKNIIRVEKFKKAFPINGMESSGMVRFAAINANNIIDKEDAMQEFYEIYPNLDKRQKALFSNIIETQYRKAAEVFKNEYSGDLEGAMQLAIENANDKLLPSRTFAQFKFYYPNVDDTALKETIDKVYEILPVLGEGKDKVVGKSAILEVYDAFKNQDTENQQVTTEVDSTNELQSIKSQSVDKLRIDEDVFEPKANVVAPKNIIKEKTYQTLSQEIANFNANKKFGGVNFPKDNKTIKIEQTIEEKIANMDSKQLSAYTKGLVKKVNELLGNKSVKPKIVNNILTTSRLGDFGATFEPPLTPKEIEVLEQSNQILSSAEMAEMDANVDKDIIYNKVDNTTLNKAENAVNKRLKTTFNKTLDELITAAKIVESKVQQGSDSMNDAELNKFIVETFLPNSVKNSIKARADGSLFDSVNTDDIALAFKYVAAFSLSPTLEDLKNYQGDVRADVTTPLQKPPIPLSSPINQYSGGLMSRQ